MSDLSLIDFTSDHVDELVPMWRDSFERGVGIVDPHPLAEQRAFLLNEIVPHYQLRVAMADDRLVGFIAANRESISQLYVHVDHQGRGIGSQLLAWAKEQSAGRLWLYTLAKNNGAQRFYERRGFQVVERGFEEQWQLEDIKYEWRKNLTVDR